jgi:hypothetical protein
MQRDCSITGTIKCLHPNRVQRNRDVALDLIGGLKQMPQKSLTRDSHVIPY